MALFKERNSTKAHEVEPESDRLERVGRFGPHRESREGVIGMGAAQRRKGAAGERTVISLLKDAGFRNATRNLNQTRDGGCDIVGVEPFSIEVKNHRKLCINQWWRQTTEQAKADEVPVLIYHIPNTSQWLCKMPMSAVNSELSSDRTVTMSFEDFVYIARELLPP